MLALHTIPYSWTGMAERLFSKTVFNLGILYTAVLVLADRTTDIN